MCIDRADIPVKDIKLKYTKVYCNGKAKKPGVTITGLKKGVDFTVSYKNNKLTGKASVIIRGIGNYEGTYTKTFRIVPKPVVLARVAKRNATSAVLKWGRIKDADRYLIYRGKTTKGSKFKLVGRVAGKKDKIKRFRYATSDPTIAKVSASGKIKAKRKGKCRIYVIGTNGSWRAIRLTVR